MPQKTPATAVAANGKTTAEFVFVTPDLAQKWLGANVTNRNLSKSLVARYARDIVEGRWKLNGATISFASGDDLLDAQHRLHAIIQAQTLDQNFAGLEMLVVRGLEPESRVTIDSGRLRSVADELHMRNLPEAQLTGALARVAINYLEGTRLETPRSKSEVMEFVDANPSVFEAAKLGREAYKVIRPNALGAVLFLGMLSGGMETRAESFVRALARGAGLREGDPRLALRTAFFSKRQATGRAPEVDWCFHAIGSAWNNFVTQRELRVIRPQKDAAGDYAVPNILGGPERGAGKGATKNVPLASRVRELVLQADRAEKHSPEFSRSEDDARVSA